MSRAVSSASSSGAALLLEDTALLALAQLLVQPQQAAKLAAAITLMDSTAALQQWCAAHADIAKDDASVSTAELADWLVSQGWKLLAEGEPYTASPLLLHTTQQMLRLEQLETSFAATLETERLQAMKELAYGASHEVNNPLANISSRAQTLLADETDPARRTQLATINVQAFRAHEMISSLMLFANPPAVVAEPTNVHAVAAQVVQELSDRAKQQGTTLQDAGSSEATVSADPNHIANALKALVENSLEAVQQGGAVQVAVAYKDNECQISVTDTGPGVSDEVATRMFDPFYSGREAGRGLGFGLSKCWRIAEMHGGRLTYENTPTGARFQLMLPRHDG